MRIGIAFAKTGAARYISHLDLQRAFSRAIRRSDLPVKLSAGFNPHYVVSFASALALGTESECECVEMVTTKDVPPDAFLQTLNQAFPPGIRGIRAVRLCEHAPKLMAALREAEYRVRFVGTDINNIKNAIRDIMESEKIVAEKNVKGVVKQIDIKPMILGLDTCEQSLLMRLSAAPSGSLKPEMVLRELQKRTGGFSYRILRTGLFANSGGVGADLLTACKEE